MMGLEMHPLHDVTRIEVDFYDDQVEADLFVNHEGLGVSVDAIQLDDPVKVCYGTHNLIDLHVEYKSAMCRVDESDGFKILYCQEW